MQEKNYNRKGRFYTAESANEEDVIPCGFIQGKRFSACYRSSSCWMKTAFIDTIENLPAETQYLLAETETGYTLYFALCDGTSRASLFAENGMAYCRVETGDRNLPLGDFRYIYALDCENPYDGMKYAYEELQKALGTFILKKDKRCLQLLKQVESNSKSKRTMFWLLISWKVKPAIKLPLKKF